jgi:serine/threonine protein kinase
LGGETDYIKIIDFGVAKLLASDAPQSTENEWDTEDLTADGVLLGTPAYMAPEQFEGREITVAADVFSLGAVLYYALTGQAPYVGSNLMAIRSAHYTPLTRVSDLAPFVIPEALEEIVMRCLERDPPRRYADAAELDAALAAADLDEAVADVLE